MSEKLQKAGSKLRTKADFAINFATQNMANAANNTKYTRLINDPDVSSSQDTQPKMNYEDDEHKSPYVPDHSVYVCICYDSLCFDSQLTRLVLIECSTRLTTVSM